MVPHKPRPQISCVIHLSVSNWRSRVDRELDQPSAMHLPSELNELRTLSIGFSGHFCRGVGSELAIQTEIMVQSNSFQLRSVRYD
jgi:hypothetical protein